MAKGILTYTGIQTLCELKEANKDLPEGWQSEVRLWFHRKLAILKQSKHLIGCKWCGTPRIWWFNQFVYSYDLVTEKLGLDIKEFKFARDCFDRFNHLFNENFNIMMKKLKEEDKRVRTSTISPGG